MQLKLCSEFDKSSVQHIEYNVSAGGGWSESTIKMSGSEQGRSIGRWLTEKDSGNESEPELSTWDFSNLNISPKPLHSRPLRTQAKSNQVDITAASGASAAPTNESLLSQHAPDGKSSQHAPRDNSSSQDLQPITEPDTNKDNTSSRGFARCLRSRVIQNLSCKVSSSEPKYTSSIRPEDNNNYVAQYPATRNTAHYTARCGTLLNTTDTLLAMTLTQVPRKTRPRPFDASSLYSVTSDEFNESDDELISINGDTNSDYSLSVKSPRLSSKRKRTTTLSADLEVESLLSPSVEDSLSSCGDNYSVSDFSEPEELTNCEIPRKRICSTITTAGSRPYLDLEKMQDKVEKAASLTNKRKPRAIRIMCFSPIKNMSGGGMGRPATRSQVYTNRELVMSTRFCPLTPVEYGGVPDRYS